MGLDEPAHHLDALGAKPPGLAKHRDRLPDASAHPEIDLEAAFAGALEKPEEVVGHGRSVGEVEVGGIKKP